MQTLVKKAIVPIIEEFEKDPKKFEGTMLYPLLMERKDLAVREEKIVKELKELQDNLLKELHKKENDFMKIKGSVEIVEKMIFDSKDKVALDATN